MRYITHSMRRWDMPPGGDGPRHEHDHEHGRGFHERHFHMRGGFGGPDHPGRGRGRGPRVGKGDVRAATLLLLSEQALHGYQIIQLIEERSGGLWRPSAGSIYPALQQLEDEGLVRADAAEGRRVYHLTDEGRNYVEARRQELTAARDAVTAGSDEGWLMLRDLMHQVGAALAQVDQTGTQAQRNAARDLLIGTRRQLYRILADDAAPSDTTAGSEPR